MCNFQQIFMAFSSVWNIINIYDFHFCIKLKFTDLSGIQNEEQSDR